MYVERNNWVKRTYGCESMERGPNWLLPHTISHTTTHKPVGTSYAALPLGLRDAGPSWRGPCYHMVAVSYTHLTLPTILRV